ncbi:Protein of unknown function [Pyronema omphalodes CBS 100304]|uniref:Uncharacterized protein n=1 Tax=Pyronema omphalodes (strain CBS 100304) TaxID=1076935 RepID=U4KZZ3_PYROM|nr:Protein of unknown function [Pyronema omphalodes CBS 100304]
MCACLFVYVLGTSTSCPKQDAFCSRNADSFLTLFHGRLSQ